MKRFEKTISNDLINQIKSIDSIKVTEVSELVNKEYDKFLLKNNLRFEFLVIDGIDSRYKYHKKEYDQYTSIIEVNLLFGNSEIKIPYDNSYCQAFQTLTYIYWDCFKKMYTIYQNDNFDELFNDLKVIVCDVEEYGFVCSSVV